MSTLEQGQRVRAEVAAPDRRRRERVERHVYTEWLVLAVLALLLGATWWLAQGDWFKPGDDVGYWLGVVGGVMMVLLLLYPLRKRVKWMHRTGHVKAWLWGHMLLGIGGPLLILLHCKFQAGSTNAAAALYSMLIVAGSGVVGRFLYVRTQRGVIAERETLNEQRNLIQAGGPSVLSRLPTVCERLHAFEVQALKASDRAGSHWLRLVAVLPFASWKSRLQTQWLARRELQALAKRHRWDADALKRRSRRVRRDIVTYYVSVMRVALFTAWERLFALWHVAHVPFVFLLVIAGVVHVVAVHAY